MTSVETGAVPSASGGTIRSTIPARIDRLPWSGFHTKLIIALGVAWILDGLEITVASSVAGALTHADTLNLTPNIANDLGTPYLAGEILGALIFGMFSDRWGRRNLFMVTLAVYLVGSGLSALTLGTSTGWVVFLFATRVIAGMGIGGETAAINSAIDEMIPAKYRGRVDIGINGTYWAGAMLGSAATLLFLNAIPESVGWRLGFLLGPVVGIFIIYIRRNLPESPRWQIMHGRAEGAEESIAFIEQEVAKTGVSLPPIDDSQAIEIQPTDQRGYLTLLRMLFAKYPGRSVLGAGLMITQSFLYNAIFFSFTTVLAAFFGVGGGAPLYLLAFSIGNLIGPLVLGPLFDTVGRRQMIGGTYLLSGVLLAVIGLLFNAGVLNALSLTIAFAIVFFFASAGASAAYLTVSEVFPQEVRAKAIGVFYSISQGAGIAANLFFGALIGSSKHPPTSGLFVGYLSGAGIMVIGGLIAVFLGVDAAGKSLEDVATPLSVVQRVANIESMGHRPPSARPDATG
ncbi:MAG TPA: MFS transporter [Pseudonocardiaceae bacterium]